jgi:hypothetical protein
VDITPLSIGSCTALAGCDGGGVGAGGVGISPAKAGQQNASIKAATPSVFRIGLFLYEFVEWVNRPSREDAAVFLCLQSERQARRKADLT